MDWVNIRMNLPVKLRVYDNRFGPIVLAFPRIKTCSLLLFIVSYKLISLSGIPPVMNTPMLAPSKEYGLIPVEKCCSHDTYCKNFFASRYGYKKTAAFNLVTSIFTKYFCFLIFVS